MLIYRIQRSMDLVLEGIDTCDTLLIEAASSEFKAGFEGLKGSIQEFQQVVADVGLKGLIEPYQALQKQLDAVDLDKVPETFSYEQELKMLKKPSGDSPPETMISSIAMNHDINVNACKDAVIVLAQYIEKFGKGLFTVGTQGIQMTGEFQSLVKVDPFRIGMFGAGDPLKVLAALAGLDEPQGEDSVGPVKEHWKPLWDVDGKGEDGNWEKFQELIKGLKDNSAKAYEAAGLAIQQGKPSQEFQQEVPKEGAFAKLFGGLFKSKDASKLDPKAVMGKDANDENGLMGLPFDKLSELVGALLEMSADASEAAQSAVEEINNNQEKIDPDEEVVAFEEKLIDLYDETKGDLQKSEQSARALVAFEKILGDKTPVTEKNVKALDSMVLAKALKEKFSYEQDDIKRLFELLEIDFKSDEDESDDAEKEDPLDVIADFDNVKDEEKEEWLGMAEEENVIDGSGAAKEDNTKEEVEDIVGVIVDDLSDEEEKRLEDSLLPDQVEESLRLINRWGQLAGIIKG